jgi:cyclopropane fatty-acyl-phospholipid synthase-like methyltransferase
MKEKLEQIRELAVQNKINQIVDLVDDLLGVEKKVESTTQNSDNNNKEFEVLKKLLESNNWPEAVFEAQIADENSEKDKEERAEGISDILLPVLDNKKFLDFGCGQGHVVKYNSKFASISVGYDIKNSVFPFIWEKLQDKMLLTTDFSKVEEQGPYDVILLYDVLDHVENETMEQVLEKAKSVLAQDGTIYLRCHPWSGRHGGHAYKKINKAFINLVFSDEELTELGLVLEPNQKIVYPIKTYDTAIRNVGLVKQSEAELDTQEVEEFFEQNPLVKNRILKSFGIEEWSASTPKFQMSQCFLDYVLKK